MKIKQAQKILFFPPKKTPASVNTETGEKNT
jgi:hypothetical protein